MKTLILFTLALASFATSAEILSLSYNKETPYIAEVAVSVNGTLTIDDRATLLVTESAKLREKDVLWAVPIYVTQLFSAATLARHCDVNGHPVDDTTLNSLKDQKAVAIRLTFKRSLSETQIDTNFRASLKANGVDIADPAVESFLNAVIEQAEVDNNTSLTIAGERLDDGSEVLTVEDAHGKLTKIQSIGIIKKVFSIWLGKPAKDDPGLERHIKSLLCEKLT